MNGMCDKISGSSNDAIVSQLVRRRRRCIWWTAATVSVIALIAAIVGCLFKMRTQGVQSEVAEMRDEIGLTLTMMSLGDANEAIAKHIPKLIDTISKWNNKFAKRREGFRGLDREIDQVQEMVSLKAKSELWRKELESVSPTARSELWKRSVKAQIEVEQKKWPNRMQKKSRMEWCSDYLKEFYYGVKYALTWPVGIVGRTVEIMKGGGAIERLDVLDRLRYIFFPYNASSFAMLRLGGIVLTLTGLGYLMCWIGLKSRFGWFSYAGLLYFFYLLIIAIFIICLEVTK